MQDQLLGYLLDALEPDERADVERALTHDANLRGDLESLRLALVPIAADREHYVPPAGLFDRCCEYVRTRADVMPAALSPIGGAVEGGSRKWSWLDVSVAGAIGLAVCVLIVPAILQSRAQSKILECQNNMKDIGTELIRYSDRNDGHFPMPAAEDRLNAAGMWAPTLVSQGYLPRERAVVCPSTPLAEEAKFRVPNIDELRAMSDAELAAMLPRIGGSYGYTLGYRDGANYKPHKNQSRKNFAILADAPSADQKASLNHGGCGQNVLFEDGRVQYLNTCKPDGTSDDIFHNERGEVAPGLHANDAVIVPGHLRVSK